MERKPAVAGQFYPGNEGTLRNEVNRLLRSDSKPKRALGVVAPHAGYIYSGSVAGAVFASVHIPKRCIVLSPNHTGVGARAAIMNDGSWSIPTGKIPVDKELADLVLANSSHVRNDVTAHLGEHSLEVELPFLLARQPELAITPITLSHLNLSACQEIGDALAAAAKQTGDEILIVASTDMNHYEDQAHTLEKDRLAIEKVESLDARGLLATCAEHRISMCGVIPTAIAIHACKELGATRATLVSHRTSGDVSGDYDAVVGYAGFVIE